MRTLLCIMMLVSLGLSGQTTVKSDSKKEIATTNQKGTDYSKFHNGDLYKSEFFIFKKQNVKNEFIFLVGSNNVEGYDLDVCKVSVDISDPDMTKKYNNGRSAPVIQLLVANNFLYIGGYLEDEKGNKTIITNSKVEEDGKTLKFTVEGKKFSRNFTLESGQILKQDSNTMVMYTSGVGVWKIHKKQS